jgi:mannose-6-phosphate isomerase-like protein (cupin superfamily)
LRLRKLVIKEVAAQQKSRERTMPVQVINQRELPSDEISHDLIGAAHCGAGVSVIFVDAPPGRGPCLHKHPAEEIFIIVEGKAEFVGGERHVRAGGGDIVIVLPDPPDSFTRSGPGRLRQIDIHVNSTFTADWL